MARLLDSLTDAALEQALALDTPRPGDEQLPDELRLRNGRSAYEAPGRAPLRHPRPGAHRTRAHRRHRGRRGDRADRRRRPPVRRAAARVGHRARRRPGRGRARHPHLRPAGRVPGRPGRNREVVRRRRAGARLDHRADQPRPGVRPGHLADRHRRPGRRRLDRAQRHPLAGHPSHARPRPRRRRPAARSRATRRGGCTPGTWSSSTSRP